MLMCVDPKRLLRTVVVSAGVGLASYSWTTLPAQSYQIDCAILLCLAGGFPASAECSAAHAEMIRRITPWPIEPPLQLWRCPMGGATISASVSTGGVPDEVRSYRDGIEVWQLSKSSMLSSGGREVYRTAIRHSYHEGGEFRREGVQETSLPGWVEEQLEVHADAGMEGEFGSFRGILMRMQDYRGSPSYEWVPY